MAKLPRGIPGAAFLLSHPRRSGAVFAEWWYELAPRPRVTRFLPWGCWAESSNALPHLTILQTAIADVARRGRSHP